MIVETTLAIISTITLTILLRRLKSFCDNITVLFRFLNYKNRNLPTQKFVIRQA